MSAPGTAAPATVPLAAGGATAPARIEPLRGLYGITPDWTDTDRLRDAVAAAIRGGLGILQLRSKTLPAPGRRQLAQSLRPLCADAGVGFIVNDDWRLALDVGADGVHLGRDDGDLAEARRAGGPGLRIGASCYDDLARARQALAAGADHVAFGAVFDSPTKPAAVRAPLSLLRQAHALRAPHAGGGRPAIVAIGGIETGNAARVAAAGADALAVITALFGAPDVEAAARAFCAAIAAGHAAGPHPD